MYGKGFERQIRKSDNAAVFETYDFVLKNYYRLRFSQAVATDVKEADRNPKRVQREVRKQLQNIGIGTNCNRL